MKSRIQNSPPEQVLRVLSAVHNALHAGSRVHIHVLQLQVPQPMSNRRWNLKAAVHGSPDRNDLYIINPFHPEDLLRSHRTGDPGVVADLIVPGVGGIHFGGCKGANDDADDDKEISWIKLIWVVHVCLLVE